MALDPVVEGMLKQMAEAGGTPLTEMAPPAAREMYRMMSQAYEKADMHSVTELSADGVPVRVYHPSEDPDLPCLVFYHGGGWVIGDLDTHDNIARNLARAVNCVVVSTDYRLAPEHPFPAPLEDCFTALKWVAAHAGELGIDANKIAVGGDSAGGNLSAAVCLMARESGGPRLVHQLLLYPVTDHNFETESYAVNGEGFMLTREGMQWFFNHYLAAGADSADPLVSPLRAKDLAGLPTATIVTAEFDPLRDEGEAYGEKLSRAGVDVLVKRFDGMIHGFVHMSDLLTQGADAIDLAALRLRREFDD
ncbi:MAG: alpha/beta hydrolase [Pseudomonadales bacterium]